MTSFSDFEIVPLSPEYEEDLKNLLLEMDETDFSTWTRFEAVTDEETAAKTVAELVRMDPEKERGFIVLDKSCGKVAGYISHIYFTEEQRRDTTWAGGLFIAHAYRGRGLGKIMEQYRIEKAAREMGKRKDHGTIFADNKAQFKVVRSAGNIVQGLFINEEKWDGKPRDIVRVAIFFDGSVTQEEATRRHLELARKASELRQSRPVAARAGFEVVELSPRYKEEFRDFLLDLDRETLKNYTRFGTIIGEEEAKKIAKDKTSIEPQRERGFVVLDKTGGKIAGYGSLELFPSERKSHVARSSLVVSPACQGRGLGKMLLGHMIDKAKELGIEKIWSHVYWDDERSFKLACSFGYIVEALFVDDEKWGEDFRSVISMALFVSEPVTQEEATQRYLEILQEYYREK